jgi:hypothetical protein
VTSELYVVGSIKEYADLISFSKLLFEETVRDFGNVKEFVFPL